MLAIALMFLAAPNLVVNGGFEEGAGACPSGWDDCFIVHDKNGKELRPKVGETLLGSCVRWEPATGVAASRAVCIEMDAPTAEGYGQGYFSKPIAVTPGVEYELTAAVKSDGPNAILFVKGYARVNGAWREVYTKHKEAHFDRYLEKGDYTTETFRFTPRHSKYPVEQVRVWLYAYLKPGRLWCDNVAVTQIGPSMTPPSASKNGARPAPPSTPDEHPPIYVNK